MKNEYLCPSCGVSVKPGGPFCDEKAHEIKLSESSKGSFFDKNNPLHFKIGDLRRRPILPVTGVETNGEETVYVTPSIGFRRNF